MTRSCVPAAQPFRYRVDVGVVLAVGLPPVLSKARSILSGVKRMPTMASRQTMEPTDLPWPRGHYLGPQGHTVLNELGRPVADSMPYTRGVD